MLRLTRAMFALVAPLLVLAACSDPSGPGGRVPSVYTLRVYGPESGRITGNTPASPGSGIPAGALSTTLDSARIAIFKLSATDEFVEIIGTWKREVPNSSPRRECRIDFSGYITPSYGTTEIYPVRLAPNGVQGLDTVGLRITGFNVCVQLSSLGTNIVVPQVDLDEADGQLSLNIRVTGDSSGSVDATFIGSTAGTAFVTYSNMTSGAERVRFDLFGGMTNFERRRDGSFYANGVFVAAGGPPPGTGTGGTFPPGTVVCPTVPSGFICVTVSGVSTPLKLMPTGVTPATYINTGSGVCMSLGNAGVSSFRYESGIGPGGARTESGRWGALVASTGVVTGTADGRQVFLYTGSFDSQIALLTYDTVQRLPVGGGWTRGGTCPYR